MAEIESAYGDSKYVFTVDESGKTVVQPFEAYDDTYEKIIKNVAIYQHLEALALMDMNLLVLQNQTNQMWFMLLLIQEKVQKILQRNFM